MSLLAADVNGQVDNESASENDRNFKSDSSSLQHQRPSVALCQR